MRLLDYLHKELAFKGRIATLGDRLAEELPADASVLDIGCGDGALAYEISKHRTDITIAGVDVLKRPETQIPVSLFDGTKLPFEDSSFDVACLVDVLHHTDQPFELLREAARVAPVVVLKDHLTHGVLAVETLRFMDWFGNARHGVRLPYNYISEEEWIQGFDELGLKLVLKTTDFQLYPSWLSWWFDRNLHVIFKVERTINSE